MKRYEVILEQVHSNFTIIFVVSVAISLLFSSQGRSEIVDRIAAKVKGDIITLSEVQERTLLISEKIRAENNDIKIEDIERIAINSIIADRLKLQHAKEIGIEATDDNIHTALEDIKDRNSLTDKMLEKFLKEQGQTMDNYRTNLREQIILSKVVDYEVRSRIRVDDNEIKEYYEKHLNYFFMPEEVNIRHILFLCDEDVSIEEEERVREKALLILKKIREGKDFIELAKIHSEDPSASSGGDLGFFKKGTMVAPLEKVAFSLKTGEVSDLVRTKYGFHIIRVEGKKESAPRSIDEVREGIRNRIFAEKLKERYNTWIAELKDASYVEILMPMESENGEWKRELKTREEKSSDVTMSEEVVENMLQEDEQYNGAIMRIVWDWKESWERKDIERYISLYSTGFRAGEMDREDWMKNRDRNNSIHDYIRIVIKNLRITQDDGFVLATFKQEFKSNVYTDVGLKRLYFKREKDSWKIIKEEWSSFYNSRG